MRSRRIPLLIPSVLTGCIGDVDSLDEALVAWGKTETIIYDGDARLRGKKGEVAPTTAVYRAGATDFPADGTFACPKEGTVKFHGSYSLEPVNGTLVGYDYKIVFTDCTVDDLRIDGSLDASYEVELGDDNLPLDGTERFIGELEWRGEVRGRCPLGLDRDFQSGSGDFCGYDGFDAFPGW